MNDDQSTALPAYVEINLENYDNDDVSALQMCAAQAYDRVEELTAALASSRAREVVWQPGGARGGALPELSPDELYVSQYVPEVYLKPIVVTLISTELRRGWQKVARYCPLSSFTNCSTESEPTSC